MSNNNDSVKAKYIISLVIDWIITGVIMFSSTGLMIQMMEKGIHLLVYMFGVTLYYVLGDLLFRNQSIGKKVMNVELLDKVSLNKAKVNDIIVRRLVEIFIVYAILIPSIYSTIEKILDSKVVIKGSEQT